MPLYVRYKVVNNYSKSKTVFTCKVYCYPDFSTKMITLYNNFMCPLRNAYLKLNACLVNMCNCK